MQHATACICLLNLQPVAVQSQSQQLVFSSSSSSVQAL